MQSTLENKHETRAYANIPRAFSKVSLAFVLFLFLYLLIMNAKMFLRNKHLEEYEQLMQKKLAREQAQNAVLKNQVLLFSKESYVEQLAREKLGFIKRGETAFRLY